MAQTPPPASPGDSAQAIAGKQRHIQQQQPQQQDARDSRKSATASGGKAGKPPVQTSSQPQPAPPMPAQHLEKPGLKTGSLKRPSAVSWR